MNLSIILFFFSAWQTHCMHRFIFFRGSPVRDIYTFNFCCICKFTSVIPSTCMLFLRHMLSVLSRDPGGCHALYDVLRCPYAGPQVWRAVHSSCVTETNWTLAVLHSPFPLFIGREHTASSPHYQICRIDRRGRSLVEEKRKRLFWD